MTHLQGHPAHWPDYLVPHHCRQHGEVSDFTVTEAELPNGQIIRSVLSRLRVFHQRRQFHRITSDRLGGTKFSRAEACGV